MSMAKFDTVETPENHEVKPPEVIEDTESIKSGDGESGIDSEIENFAKMGEDEPSNETSNETKESPEDSEVKNSYAEGMSEADKESYGISSEIEDFVKTGQMDDVKLPSEMQNEGVDTLEGSEKNENPYAEGMSEADKESYGISSEIEAFVKTGQIDDVELPSEMQNEGVDTLEGSEKNENRYAEGMTEVDKEAYGISSEIEDFVKTGQMDEVKLPSEMQNEGVDLSENSNLDSEIEKTTDGTDENDNDKLTLMDKVKLASAAILTGLSIRADQEAYAQDISNLTRDNTIERVEAPPEDYSGMAENFRDAASEILKKSEDEEGEGEGLEGGKEISSDVGEDGKTIEVHTSFEQDGTTLQEAWNTDVDNVAYDQNDDE